MLLAMGVVAAAPPSESAIFASEKPQIRLNHKDEVAARSVTIHARDLPGSGWRGGSTKPEIGPDPCPTYHPRQADLVVTGSSASEYHRGPIAFSGNVQIMKTSQMVRFDWDRSVSDPRMVPCERRYLAKVLGPGARIESFRRLRILKVAPYVRQYRAIVTRSIQGVRVPLLLDAVLLARGRFEMTINVVAPLGVHGAISSAERVLARVVVARMHA